MSRRGGTGLEAWGAAGLLLVVVVAYLPVLDAGYIWDDDYYVTENDALRDLRGLGRIWTDTSTTPQYYPLTHTSYWLQYQLSGLTPWPYHLCNVLLHGLSAVLLWRILRRLKIPAAWVGAALFALHPVHVESVAWITERKNVLSGVFYLAAALIFLRAALSEEAPGATRPRIVAFVLYVAALLSKTVTVSLPVVLALAVLWRRRRLSRRDVWTLVPMLGVGAFFARLTVHLEVNQVLATGDAWSFSFVERCLIAARAIWFYLGKLVLPVNLSFNYPRWEIDGAVAWQYVPLLAAIALALILLDWARRRTAGPLLAYVFFGVTLFPALGFFNVYPMLFSFVADHFQYLASIGPLALLGAVLGHRLPDWIARSRPGSRRWLQHGLPVVVLVVLALLTFRQSLTYHDSETLWRTTLDRNPTGWMARVNLGHELQERGETPEANRLYGEVTRLHPELPAGWAGLGSTLLENEQLFEARDALQRALELGSRDGRTHYNLAVAHEKIVQAEQGNRPSDAAIHHYREAIRRLPGMARAHYGLAVHLYYKGLTEQAWQSTQRAIELGYEANPAFLRALQDARGR